MHGSLPSNCALENERYASYFDSEFNVLWGWLDNPGASCFDLSLINDIERVDRRLTNNRGYVVHEGQTCPVNYYVVGSRSSSAFSYGGDLTYFVKCIENSDRQALMAYATRCIDILYQRLRHYSAPRLITMCLLQADALGGGFEFALANDIIIAEAHVKLGLPETRFNLFPGMGAHSFLSRRVGCRVAEQMVLSGELYCASKMLEMGIIDQVVPSGQGVEAINAYLSEHHQRHNSHAAIFQARQAVWPVTRDELMSITRVWVDAALRLQNRDLRLMARLARSQTRLQQRMTS